MKEPKYTQSSLKEVCVARALFSNVAEYPDELAFDKGDILRVLSYKPGISGVSEGWWLCVDRVGRRGLVPSNRVNVMQRFDQGFFEVAGPLMDEFFHFNQSSPFDDPFFRGVNDRPCFSSALRDRLEPQPLRRLNSCDDALKGGVVRNIPIRVENTDQRPFQSTHNLSERPNDRRFSDFPQPTREIRRTVSSGRVSPPLLAPAPPARRSFLAPQDAVVPRSNVKLRSNSTVSSEGEEEEGVDRRSSIRSDRSPQRTLIIPSAVPGRNIEIPLDDGPDERDYGRRDDIHRSKSPKLESQIDRLAQRLKSFTKPFRAEHHVVPQVPHVEVGGAYSKQEARSPSPSSSGIGADITDSNSGEENNKRSSDLSSLSSSDHNSFLSDQGETPILVPSAPSSIPPFSRPSLPPSSHSHQPYLSRLTREKSPSTSVLQAVFDTIDRPQQLHKYASQNTLPTTNTREWVIPTTVEEDMRRNGTPAWNHVPTTVTPSNNGRNIGDVLEEEIESRKRIVCNRMAECLKMIEYSVATIGKCTAAQHWRAAHLLQPNLNSLRDSVAGINEALDWFVEATGRVSIDRTNPKSAELSRLLSPLNESRSLVGCLRRVLDQAGWTVAVLSRDRQQRTMDSLEQLVAVAPQVPADCRRVLQWVQLLVPSSTVLFLSPSSMTSSSSSANQRTPVGGAPFSHPISLAQTLDRPSQLSATVPDSGEKRLSSSSNSTVTSDGSPSSILVTRGNDSGRPSKAGRVTFADQAPDRSSLGSSSSSSEYATIVRPNKESPPRMNGGGFSNGITTDSILEEDDLESVMSDRDSLYQDYAYLDDVVPGRSNGNSEKKERRNMNDEDRQLVQFYAPQLEQHTESLSLAIEQFLATVEQNLPPREFVQKGKLIILSAHKLIYIGDSVAQCLRDGPASNSMRQSADSLCELLKNCVRATKQAADEYPEIRSMQGMVDSIIAVSKAAHQLKHVIKECC